MSQDEKEPTPFDRLIGKAPVRKPAVSMKLKVEKPAGGTAAPVAAKKDEPAAAVVAGEDPGHEDADAPRAPARKRSRVRSRPLHSTSLPMRIFGWWWGLFDNWLYASGATIGLVVVLVGGVWLAIALSSGPPAEDPNIVKVNPPEEPSTKAGDPLTDVFASNPTEVSAPVALDGQGLMISNGLHARVQVGEQIVEFSTGPKGPLINGADIAIGSIENLGEVFVIEGSLLGIKFAGPATVTLLNDSAAATFWQMTSPDGQPVVRKIGITLLEGSKYILSIQDRQGNDLAPTEESRDGEIMFAGGARIGTLGSAEGMVFQFP